MYVVKERGSGNDSTHVKWGMMQEGQSRAKQDKRKEGLKSQDRME